MPPLPALRCSPGREHVIGNSHKRGQLEGAFNLETKDDELVLFNEVRNQERDNFLLLASDDFEDSLSKLRHFSDFKLGINIRTRGETSDLLNVEGDKNDYDWLLTPPDTPLFSKLDDDDSQPVNLAARGRTRSQPVPISRSMSDKSYQTSRTIYSPQRLSLSPRSSGTVTQLRGRSSSATQSSPPSVIRSTTPTRSHYSPPNKPPAPIPRSSSPTLPRKSIDSSIQASHYGGRGASLAKASRGNSSSPKLQRWQKTFPGFNSEAPPNPWISLSDPSTSHVRVSSPSSRNGRELSMKLGRKSMSPTSSRRISTSCIPENYKGSMTSCVVDIEEPLHFRAVGVSRSPPPRKVEALANNKAMSFSRKPSRTSPSNPVTKRSFDSALRQMNQRRAPQSMFRPLLSSAPVSTFRPIYSRNSSLTTSSNASSEQGVISIAPDLEDDEIEQIGLPDGWERTEEFDTDEVFLFDKVGEIIEDTSNEALSGKHQALDEGFAGILRERVDSQYIQKAIVNIDDATSLTAFELTHRTDNQCVIDGYASTALCSKCGEEFDINEITGNQNLCENCAEEDRFCTAERAFISIPFTESVPSQVDTPVVGVSQEVQLNGEVPEFLEDENVKLTLDQHERSTMLGAEVIPNNIFMQSLDEIESQPFERHLDLKIDVPECTGISVVLLQRSASTKWPILQGKAVPATNIPFSEPPYSRNTFNALRRSIVADSVSVTSSIDLGLPRQTEDYVQHQLSRKSEAHFLKRDIDSNAQSFSSDKDASTDSHEPRSLRNEFGEIFSSSSECLECKSSKEMEIVSEDHMDSLDQHHSDSTSSTKTVISEKCTSVYADNLRKVSTSESRDFNSQLNNYLPCSSATEIMCAEKYSSSTHIGDDYQNSGNACNIERTSDSHVCSEMVEDHIIVNHTCENMILDSATDSSSIMTAESQDVYSALENRQSECMFSCVPPSPEHSNGPSILKISGIDISLCSSEAITEVLENGESDIIVESPSRHLSRNLLLEAATNNLFCSSIIHDLAYKAAAIAIEKDREVLADHRAPLPVTIPGKSIPGLREESGKKSNKHPPRSQKFRRKKIETQPHSPLREVVNEAGNAEEFTTSKVESPKKLDGEKPRKLESKCNCSVM